MKKLWLVWAGMAVALAAPPPVLDRELFFGDPEISGAQLSPDGQYISFMKPWNKTRNIWVKKAGEPFSAAHLVTAETKRPVPGHFWSRDGQYILFVQDQAGDENFNVYAVKPTDTPAAGEAAPKARNITEAKGVRAQIFSVPKSRPGVIYVGLNDRDKAWHDLYEVNIATGAKTLIRKNMDRITGWVFDLKDQLRMATRSAENGDTEVLRVEGDKFEKVYSCGMMESCGPERFHKDGKRVYFITNKGARDLVELTLFDPATGKEEFVERDPKGRVDLSGASFSEVTDELIATIYVAARREILWKDAGFAADYKWLQGKLPGREISLGSHTKDERLWLVSANGDTEPGETYLFDRKAKTLVLQYRIREKMPREHLAGMKAVEYPSSDGLIIPAYLTLPKGVEPKNLPVLMVPHGGPWARDFWGYNTLAQFWANRGFAVMSMNFRGSTGYGKKFLDAGNNEWGQKMQDDITWGVKYLVKEGIANPKRVGILGGSYGGYATLAGVAFTPEVYAAGVAIVAPSNLMTLLDSIPAYWESGRKQMYARMGDPGTPAGQAQLKRQSPLNSAGRIKSPLMVVQGANDPRVNKAESDQIVIALRDRGFPVEYLVADDEGHGFARPVNNLAMIAAAEKFLAKHLDTRSQEEVPEEVAKRLKEISVDPKTVTLAKKVDASQAGELRPERELKTGLWKYAATISMGTQSIKMDLSTEIKEENGAWTVTDTMKSPMTGEALDTTVLEKGRLVVKTRQVKQGPVTVALNYEGGHVTGKMETGGPAREVKAELGGPAFGEAAGTPFVLGTLPLKEGYEATFRNFDLQKSKLKLMQLKVAGSEKVTVPAGTFETFALEVTAADNPGERVTYYVDKATRVPVKFAAVLPSMGGAKLTAELQ